MTSTEYEKQKAELEKEFTLKKGKLAEEYLKEHGVLDENGRPIMARSYTDMYIEDLINLRDKLRCLTEAIDYQIKYKRSMMSEFDRDYEKFEMKYPSQPVRRD